MSDIKQETKSSREIKARVSRKESQRGFAKAGKE